ncbi:AAA family ATPase [Anaeromicropila herbilytica]|uniref:AAA+ ATPase domain-containing protein n=1 Tax=Anaeromicropila herbilytica TaxID=2785025 RepID=A0A7R7IAU2_9FIRM|nr:AAA family ATPase [Anaeromicropila herbilytica]BCN28792.1 hypothetical protein bsdtb5_00870 [Anaeromicropila herbilytica]
MSFKELMKFLFPEYQVIESIKNDGVIKRKKNEDSSSPNKVLNRVQLNNNHDLSIQTSNKDNDTINNNQPETENSDIQQNIDIQQNTTTQQIADNSEEKNNDISTIFNEVKEDLKNNFIGQEKYFNSLCIAFKRPFITGYNDEKPRNVIIIQGHESSGKQSSICCIAKCLKERKIFTYRKVKLLDLSLYQTASEFELFLSDLYSALYSKSHVLIFENFHKCHSSIINVIQTLATTGNYKLKARYAETEYGLVETTGGLVEDTVSGLSSNNMYFVILSDREEKEIQNIFGLNFMKCVGDYLHMDSYTEDELKKLVEFDMNDLVYNGKENLSIEITYDNKVISYVVSRFKISTGIAGMTTFIDSEIYKPLAELKLNNNYEYMQTVGISIKDEKIVASIADETIQLDMVIPKIDSYGLEEIKNELEQVIGIQSVKKYISSLENNLQIQKLRESKGLKVSDISMHMIFTGNPGTGKTMIARMVAKYLKALGILSEGQLREVTRADMVGEYVGQTARITNDVIQSAIGGVLFIDEAYSLCRDKNDSYGLEAVDALVKGIEDNRDDLVVILAGYQEEMEEFLKVNSGLKSRFPNIICFEDYTADEMYDISQLTASSKGYKISEDCKEPLIKLFDQKQTKGKNDSGNGRLVRNVIESAILNQSKRLLNSNTDEMDVLNYEDFGFQNNSTYDLEDSLSKIIGLDTVKEYINSLNARLKIQNERKKLGLIVDSTQTLHMVFKGNPGTGKTMIARVIADVLYHIGVIKTNKLVETDRSGLVAGYVGQTAIKTREKILEALDGVLFIDEAYSLSQGGENDYGKEAIDTLVKLMDDNRDRIVVILAGYSDDMDSFLSINAGLKSRFPNIIEFEDYSAEQLVKISELLVESKGYELSLAAKDKLYDIFSQARQEARFGNGRYVRNLIERAINNQSVRLSKDTNLTKEELIAIEDTDIEKR